MDSMQRSLLLAKELFAHSQTHAQQGGELDRMIAIHGFDNAVEVTLHAVVRKLDLRCKQGRDGVMDLIACIGDMHGPIPERDEIRSLHLARNAVQHSALAPSGTDVRRWCDVTGEFLRRAMQEYFTVDMDTLSAATFIEDETLRRLLQAATALLRLDSSRHEVERAFLLAVYAFECPSAVGHERKRFRELLPLLSTSVTRLDLERCDSLPARAFHSLDGSVVVHWQPQKLTVGEVQWFVPFAVHAIVEAQSQLTLLMHDEARSDCEEILSTPVDSECA